MYRGFKLELPEHSYTDFIHAGGKTHASQFNEAKVYLDNFILKENILDGSAIQKFWFPETRADIFLSHSHKDLDQAKSLAGWLESTFGLKVFIDSCVWLHGKDLKQYLANNYCTTDKKGIYSYKDFSHACTHVDIMLSSALSMMIDKCECLFFLNTPNSIQPYENNPRTESAWIYNEIEISKLIHKKKPVRWLNESKDTLSKALNGLTISYEADVEHLQDLSQTDLEKWKFDTNFRGPNSSSLDVLYKNFTKDSDLNMGNLRL